MAFNPFASFKERMLRKYGRNLNTSKFSLPELEKLAKDVQREANRRYDIARQRAEMQHTKAYRDFVKSGGKISLSKGFEQQGNKITYNPNQTVQGRRGYLMQQIRRGFDYLDKQTSTYTGFKAWRKNQIAKAKAAMAKITNNQGTVDEFGRRLSDPKWSSDFFRAVRKYKEENFALYTRRGSPEVIDVLYQKWRDLGLDFDSDALLDAVDDALMDIGDD